MNNTSNLTLKRPAFLAMAAAVALMSACGGGSGDSSGITTTTPAPTVSSSNLVTQVPTPTYAAGSSELLAFNRINADRARCGFGLLAQNAKLDASANAHRGYMVSNQIITHTETAGLAGFTGVNPSDRDVAQGYSYSGWSEDVSANWATPLHNGDRIAALFAAGTYHSGVVTDGRRDQGLSWGGSAFVVERGTPTGSVDQSAGGVRTYPCDGSPDVVASVSLEEPSPFPGQTTTWGPTISVVGDQVKVTSAAITGPGGSVAIRAIYGDGQQQDPNSRCGASLACVIPVTLQLGTTYQVQLAGTQAGQAFTKAFSFTTSTQP